MSGAAERDAAFWLALLDVPGAGRATAWRVADAAGRLGVAPAGLVEAAVADLLAQGVDGNAAAHVAAARGRLREAEATVRRAREAGAEPVPWGDARYPDALRACLGAAAPPLLFLRGALELISRPGAAIVGGRTPEPEAARCARDCAAALVEAGAVIVSGGAKGIDTAAHEGALAAGGTTVVVLPAGILNLEASPPLRTALDTGRVLAVSEFPPRAPWATPHAVTRNGTISALSRLLCLLAPRRQGGSVATARWSLASGKPVGYAFAESARSLTEPSPLAFPLLGAGGILDRDALLDAWHGAPDAPPAQPRLF